MGAKFLPGCVLYSEGSNQPGNTRIVRARSRSRPVVAPCRMNAAQKTPRIPFRKKVYCGENGEVFHDHVRGIEPGLRSSLCPVGVRDQRDATSTATQAELVTSDLGGGVGSTKTHAAPMGGSITSTVPFCKKAELACPYAFPSPQRAVKGPGPRFDLGPGTGGGPGFG
jgi:hypothetical protein